jgi:hypothetical protein
MAYEKAFQNHYHELDANTQYRFAEIELGKALITLSYLYEHATTPRSAAIQHLLSALVPKIQPQQEESFVQMLQSSYTIHPPKHELIHYLIIHGHSYKKVRDLTGCAFNTISKARMGLPQYYPHYAYWDQYALATWNKLKRTLNLFNEDLAHTKE